MEELWKAIPEFSHSYSISNFGRVRNHKTGRILKSIDQSIMRISLYTENHKSCNRSIPHLVACAFIPNPNNYQYVIHKDNDHTNNHVSNLMWSAYPTDNRLSSRKPIPVYCETVDKVFNSYRECESYLGLSNGSLYQYFKSGRKRIKGYHIVKVPNIT